MTSRDLTENVEQLQVRLSLELVRDRTVAVLARLGRLSAEYGELVMAGRSHNVAAQATTSASAFATAADELLVACARPRRLLGALSPAARHQRARWATAQEHAGSAGGGDAAKDSPNWRTESPATWASGTRVRTSVGQVYPRSLDYEGRHDAGAAGRGTVVAGERRSA